MLNTTLYRWLLVVVGPLILIHLFWKAAREGDWQYLKQRLGCALPRNKTDIWLHTASVGEAVTALPLIEKLQQRYPRMKLLLTTNTPTGMQTLQNQLGNSAQFCYLPIDWKFSTKRFLRSCSSKLGIIVETELWPQLYQQSVCPLIIVNGRLSDKTLKVANTWAAKLYSETLLNVEHVLARSDNDNRAFRHIGMPAQRITTLGNLKYASLSRLTSDNNATSKAETDSSFFSSADRAYVLLASTHEDEEISLASAWKKLHRQELLLIAPRHPKRAAGIVKQLRSAGMQVAVRSEKQTVTEHTDVYLADTFGEMARWYTGADAVFLGGSLVPVGGHNVLEPAWCKQPVVVGPHTHNFNDEVEILRSANAVLTGARADEIVLLLAQLLDQPDHRDALGRQAHALVQKNVSIADDYIAAIAPWIDNTTDPVEL